jgi:hypothetical protein
MFRGLRTLHVNFFHLNHRNPVGLCSESVITEVINEAWEEEPESPWALYGIHLRSSRTFSVVMHCLIVNAVDSQEYQVWNIPGKVRMQLIVEGIQS